MAFLRGGMEGCKRTVKTVFFMTSMLGSLLVPSLPVLIAFLDIGIPSVVFATVFKSSSSVLIEKRLRYNFRTSLLDIFFISVTRSLAIICVYAFGGIRCGAYFMTALLLGVTSTAVVTVKACVYVPGISGTTSFSNWGVALLFFSSFVCALGHGISAYRTSCQAKRKSFLQGDEQLSFFCKYTIKLKRKRFRSTAFFGKIDKDEQCTLADINSQFMLCKSLHVHYKLFEGKPKNKLQFHETQNRRQLTRTGSSYVSGATRILTPVREDSLRTPLLSSFSLPSRTDPDSSCGWFFTDAAATEHVIDFETSPKPSENERNSSKGIVLVHGFGGGVFSWRHVIGPLARQSGYSAASFDRPGWGLTSRLKNNESGGQADHPNPYDIHSQVDLLLDFCKQLGFTSVVLVGHDDGGLLALMVAARLSQSPNPAEVAVRGVVLIGVSSSREIIPAFARVLLHTSLGRHILRPLLCRSDMISRHAWHDASKLTSEVMDLYKVPLHVEGWDQSAARKIQSHVTPELLRIVQNVPALLVAGMQDMLVPLQAVQALASQLSKSKLVAIPRCGHLPPEECPGLLLAALVPFIVETLA